MRPVVFKIGGSETQNEAFLERFSNHLIKLQGRAVVVHGGGPEMAQWQHRLGLKPEFVNGRRKTDLATLGLAEMLLGGQINQRLVRAFGRGGHTAIGLNGGDGHLIQVKPLSTDPSKETLGELGFVGQICGIQVGMLQRILEAGWLPVIAPLGVDSQFQSYNINADEVAVAIAKAMGAAALIFVTGIGGVMSNEHLLPELHLDEITGFIQSGAASGGMIPKLEAAVLACKSGIQEVRIGGLDMGTRILP